MLNFAKIRERISQVLIFAIAKTIKSNSVLNFAIFSEFYGSDVKD